jgi:hypothetical protein
MTGAILLAWLKLIALDGDLARAEPNTALPHPARRRPAGPRRPPHAREIPAAWPWADDITTAWQRICAIPQAP